MMSNNRFAQFEDDIEDDINYEDSVVITPATPATISSADSANMSHRLPPAIQTPPNNNNNSAAASSSVKNKSTDFQPFDVEDPQLLDLYDEENPTFFQSFITNKRRFNIFILLATFLILLLLGILAAIFVLAFFQTTTNTDNSSAITLNSRWSSEAQVKLSSGEEFYPGKGYFDPDHSQMRVDFSVGSSSFSYVINQDLGYIINQKDSGTCTYTQRDVLKLPGYYTDHILYVEEDDCHLFQVNVISGYMDLCTRDGYIVTLDYVDNEVTDNNIKMRFSDFSDDIPEEIIYEPVNCASATPAENEDENENEEESSSEGESEGEVPVFNIRDSWIANVSVYRGNDAADITNVNEEDAVPAVLYVDVPNRRFRFSIIETVGMSFDLIYNQGETYSISTIGGLCSYMEQDGTDATSIDPKFKGVSSYRGKQCNLFAIEGEGEELRMCVTESGNLVYFQAITTDSEDTDEDMLMITTGLKSKTHKSSVFVPPKGCTLSGSSGDSESDSDLGGEQLKAKKRLSFGKFFKI